MNIYYSYTSDWPKPAVDRAVTQLPPLRREKAERYRRFEDRRESTAAVLLTLHALEASVTCSDEPMWREEPLSELIGQKDWPRLAAALDWSPAPEGKPFPNGLVLSRGRETLRRHLSLSHTAGAVAAAVSEGPVGVDIQKENPLHPGFFEGILHRFAPQEQDWLSSLPPDKQAPSFYAYWAMKESVMKLCGRGLALSLSACALLPTGSPGQYRSELEGRPLLAYVRHLPGRETGPGYILAAAEYETR